MISHETIRTMAARIAERFHPQKIVLFGSYARGDATENSDVDLLVIVEGLSPRGKRSAPIIQMLAEEYPLPVDVIVRPSSALEQWKDIPGTFAHRVSEEGIVLYEREQQ